MEIKGYTLVKTCDACPEQYDVFRNGKQVGYLRLRHGSFSVAYPDCGHRIIYFAHPEGDGIFEDHEREKYLNAAIDAIAAAEQEESPVNSRQQTLPGGEDAVPNAGGTSGSV